MARVRVGLTGGIASGKSTVARMLTDRGAVVIDSDLLAREVVAPGSAGLTRIAERFTDAVIHDDGGERSLDRAALGRVVFADPAARADLEAIVHPAVRARAAELEAEAAPDAVVVQMIPLLVETGQADAFDTLVVVDVDEAVQLARLLERDPVGETEARQRIGAQAGRAERLAAADLVIDNSAGLDELARQVDRVAVRLGLAPSEGPPERPSERAARR